MTGIMDTAVFPRKSASRRAARVWEIEMQHKTGLINNK